MRHSPTQSAIHRVGFGRTGHAFASNLSRADTAFWSHCSILASIKFTARGSLMLPTAPSDIAVPLATEDLRIALSDGGAGNFVASAPGVFSQLL